MNNDKQAHIKFINLQKQEIELEKRNIENFLENLKKEFERDKIQMEKKLSELKNMSDNLELRRDIHDDYDINVYMRVLGHSEVLKRQKDKSNDSYKFYNFEYAKQWLHSQYFEY